MVEHLELPDDASLPIWEPCHNTSRVRERGGGVSQKMEFRVSGRNYASRLRLQDRRIRPNWEPNSADDLSAWTLRSDACRARADRLKNLPGPVVDACDRSFFGCDLQTGALVSADQRPRFDICRWLACF